MTYTIKQGDVLKQLRTIPEKSVQCCVTSPPYWGLRDYGVDGQIGLEESPAVYVEKMVNVFREVKRVLRDDGTFWLNVGDSYKNKALSLIPSRLIIALQDDGWLVRSEIVWAKKAPMPEAVKDRPTSSWEPLFLLTKSGKYYYDADAVRTEGKEYRGRAGTFDRSGNGVADHIIPNQSAAEHRPREDRVKAGANLRNVWHIGPEPFKDAHFATFPTEIPRKAILAGTKEGDVVLDPFCGSGTTLMVAEHLERDSIGIELNPEYAEIAEKRVQSGLPLTRKKKWEGEFKLEQTS